MYLKFLCFSQINIRSGQRKYFLLENPFFLYFDNKGEREIILCRKFFPDIVFTAALKLILSAHSDIVLMLKM